MLSVEPQVDKYAVHWLCRPWSSLGSPGALVGLKTSRIYTARWRKEAGLYDMKKGTEVANRCAMTSRGKCQESPAMGPFRQRGKWDCRREAGCPHQPWEGWQGSQGFVLIPCCLKCSAMFIVRKVIVLASVSWSSRFFFFWLCEHLHLFVTRVCLKEICSSFHVTSISKCIPLSSSQGDAGENGPKGDAGEKVRSYEMRKGMRLSKDVTECVRSWELWKTGSEKSPKPENSSIFVSQKSIVPYPIHKFKYSESKMVWQIFLFLENKELSNDRFRRQ